VALKFQSVEGGLFSEERPWSSFQLALTDVTCAELGECAKDINNRPRKVSGWSTPAEVFHELCSKEAIT